MEMWDFRVRRWRLFVALSALFIISSFIVCTMRFRELPGYIRENSNYKHYTDYKVITELSAIVASGGWPWDNTAYLYRGLPRVPIYSMYMMGYTLLCGLIIRFTGLLPEFVVYVLMPFLISLVLPLVIWCSGRKMGFSPERTTLFLLLAVFVIDYSLVRFHGPKGEVLGVYAGILGLAYYKNREYISAGFLCGLASLFNFTNITISLVLMGAFILTVMISLFKKINVERRQVLTFVVVGCIFLPFLYTYVRPTQVKYAPRDDRLLKAIPLDEPLPSEVIVPDYTGVWEGSPIGAVIEIDEKKPLVSVLVPDTVREFVQTPFYPVTYPCWAYVGRAAVGPVSRLLGCELTQEQETDLRNFRLTTKTCLPVGIVLWYTSGFPLIFGLVWWSLLKQKKIEEDMLLALSAYSLPLLSALFRIVVGWSIAARRIIPFVEVFYMMILLNQVPQLGSKESKFLKILCVIMVIRFGVWIVAYYPGVLS